MTKHLLNMMAALFFNSVVGATFAHLFGLSPTLGAVSANLLSILLSVFTPSGGVLREGLLREVWTGEMVKALRGKLEGTWLDGITDASHLVDNDVIHLVDVGVDPDVVINHSGDTPIDLQKLEDKDIAIRLDKFQTKVTPISDDELHALSYDKMSRVIESHGNALHDARLAKAAENICVKQASEGTILGTTGAKSPVTNRKKMTLADLLDIKRSMDAKGVPAEGRRLVLCVDHVNDLLAESQNFREQYNINRNDGTIGKIYGFEIYEFANTPFYTQAGVRKAASESPTTGEFHCSFAFYNKRVFKATGSTKMYHSKAETDPEYQRNKVNFRNYFIATMKKKDAVVVMTSKYEA